ncbi:gluconate 2-dehydrogenase subunit 3 family protein [Pedobacter aquatilis]|uniref:gluconate 2-dehydrogenase subunit 3 family protein n=1 Tax=Pedobacter aquatilis TaxID=351343 RepID=UPI0029311F8A|nr:gluconate 2-dehydrogenase subunit 3 family protein [Pedobacter aquatilis]
MKRRTALKSIFALSFLSLTSYNFFRWFSIHRKFDPKLFLAHKNLISELAEVIIPETETPGAKSANVVQYIINVILNCTDNVQQNRFVEGLINVDNYTLREYNTQFVKCTKIEKEQTLQYLENRDEYNYSILNKLNNKLFGGAFFLILKNLCVEGYCISEIGATKGLSYDYIPGRYLSCIPLSRNQKSWATS